MNGLDEEYGDTLTCEIRDATSPESKEQIKQYGFITHGMVFFDAEGTVAKKLDGHLVKEPAIRAALKEVMGGSAM